MFEPRKTLPPAARRCLAKYGNYEITSVLVGRHPIAKAFSVIANLLTLGEFEKAKERLGYDDSYHLYMLFECRHADDRVVLKNHKTEVIVLQQLADAKFHELSKEAEAVRLLEMTKSITLAEWFTNTANYMGARFIPYDSIDANCQDYILSNLQANLQHVPADIKRFISQNAYDLIGNNRFIKAAMRGVTDIAGWWNRVLEGEGINDKSGAFIINGSADVKTLEKARTRGKK